MAGSGFCCGAAPDAGSVAELACGADAAGLGCCPSTGPEPARGTAETEGPATVAELACGIAETKLCSGAAPATTRKVTAYRNETMERSSFANLDVRSASTRADRSHRCAGATTGRRLLQARFSRGDAARGCSGCVPVSRPSGGRGVLGREQEERRGERRARRDGDASRRGQRRRIDHALLRVQCELLPLVGEERAVVVSVACEQPGSGGDGCRAHPCRGGTPRCRLACGGIRRRPAGGSDVPWG